MKNKLLTLYVTLLVSLLAVTGIALQEGKQWLAVSLLVSQALTFFIWRSWMNFVENLTRQTNSVLTKRDDSKNINTWSFNSLEHLQKSQKKVTEKFERSAILISSLANPEKIDTLDEVDVNDPIGKALYNIKLEMHRIKEEDDRRTWTNTSLANFAEVLRNRLEIKEYGYEIISNIVKYCDANQGALFLVYEDDERQRYMELLASYAYSKGKYSENRIIEGQGVLGQCMVEKEFLFMTDVPEDFIKITSGLGAAVPRVIAVLPLVFKGVFCGVIELASFTVFLPYQVEFLKKVCENIASEIAALKSMDNTKSLLEESNQLTQELQSREEEMKQNLEELAATQEEMARKQIELSGIINAIDSTLATAEFDVSGKLIRHNAILEQFTAYNTAYLKGSDYKLITGNYNDAVTWKKILNGDIPAGEFRTTTANNDDLWLSITFTLLTDIENKTEKILCMIQNITQKKLKEIEFERLSLVANNTDNSVIITGSDGLIEYVNAGFTKMTGYESIEVIGKKPGRLLQGAHTDKNTVEKLRTDVAKGIPVYEEILNYNKRGESYWVSLAINPVKNDSGLITKFISIQADITQTKIQALDFHQKMEALSRSNAIIEIDKHGILIDINENYLDVLGYSRHELVGQPYSLLTRKDDVYGKLVNTLNQDGIQSGVFSRYDKQGQRHSMRLMDYPVLNINGEIEKIIEFGVDVSNEIRLEREAARKQAELTSYLNGINNTVASAEFTLEGIFKDANEIFLKIMGYTQEELDNKKFDFLMGDDQTVIMMWEVLKFGKFFSGEFKMKNKFGKELWLTGTFNPITIEGNTPEKIMMFAQFTTQEKEKLNDLNAMVQALKSTLPVLEFNEDFVCKTANEKALNIFGLTRLALRSKTILDFIAPDYHLMWNKNKDQVLTNDFINFVMPFFVNNQITNYEVSVTVTRNLEGKIGKVIILLIKEVLEKVSILKAV